jgi:ribA/ribD-fused uncharacterized protein
MNDEQGLIINFDQFDGENPYAFLSNFWVGDPLWVFGEEWATGEHAFQAMKALHVEERYDVRWSKTPAVAKFRGRRVLLRPDWEQVKYDIMAAVVRSKFTVARKEGLDLLLTGDALLVEGTQWGDRVWGVAGSDVHDGMVTSPGRNWLGTLLMARRAELRAEVAYGYVHDTVSANSEFTQVGSSS